MDYRHSHQEKEKGQDYDESFKDLRYRKFIWKWEKEIIESVVLKKKQCY